MDLLTAPFTPPAAPTTATTAPLAATGETPSASAVTESTHKTTATHDDSASVLTTDTDAQLDATSDAFAKLRTSAATAGGMQLPSLKKGDSKTFSRVQARIVVWPERARKDGRVNRDEVDSEWVLEGQLWILKDTNAILFIIDPAVAPTQVPVTSSHLLRQGRSLSVSLSRTFSFGSKGDDDREAAEGDAEGEEKKGLIGFVKKVFGGGSKDEDKEGGTTGEPLARTTTRGSGSRSRRGSRSAFSLPVPLPSYQGNTITALHVPHPSTSITAIRFTSSKPATPPTGSSPPSLQAATPARVEIDVTAPSADKEGLDANQERDATVAFCFMDVLLEKDAQDFKDKLEDITAESGSKLKATTSRG
ncbi:hypothetical protein MNV49_007636 [Pseudohyphozyma bogoriensis]|nr:hypothetical protein MNV49_007636 [Pseudohyphozyma bogoriensis]